MASVGVKNDSEKIRWNHLPWAQVEQVAKITDFGAKKYSEDNNWQRVPDARNRYFNATIRHIAAWWKGEVNDPETGFNHLGHAVCCLLFLMWFDDKENK